MLLFCVRDITDLVVRAEAFEQASLSFDVEQESEFGAYVGTQVDIATNSSFNIEAQFTADAWALGFGIGWKS